MNIAAGRGAAARESLRGMRAIDGKLTASDAILWALSSVGIAGAASRSIASCARGCDAETAGF